MSHGDVNEETTSRAVTEFEELLTEALREAEKIQLKVQAEGRRHAGGEAAVKASAPILEQIDVKVLTRIVVAHLTVTPGIDLLVANGAPPGVHERESQR